MTTTFPLPNLLPHIKELWQQVLPAREVEADTHFFLGGGDSLQLTRLLLRVRQQLGVDLRLQDLPHYSTPGKMAQWCAALGATLQLHREFGGEAGSSLPLSTVEAGAATTEFAANSSQTGLWWSEQHSGVGGLYNCAVVVELQGPLQVDALAASLATLQQQFPLLAMSLQVDPAQRRLLVRRAELVPELGRTVEVAAGELAAFAADWAAAAFDLARNVFRCCLLQHSNMHHSLLLCGHHCVLDGWSGRIVLQQLAAHYRALCADRHWQPARVDTAFAAHCRRQQQRFASDLHQRQLVWWQQYLDQQNRHASALPWQPQPQLWPYLLQRQHHELPAALLPRLQALCAGGQCTLFAVLATALAQALCSIGNTAVPLIGFPVAARANVPEEQSVGCYMQLLPLVLDSDPAQPLPARLAWLHDSVQQVLAHAIPLPELVAALRPALLPDGNAWFDIVLALQNFPAPECDWSPLAASWRALPAAHGQYLLKIEVTGGRIDVDYAAEVVPTMDVITLLHAMEAALQELGQLQPQ